MAAKRSRWVGAGAVAVLALIIGFLAFSKARHVHFAPAIGNGCIVHGQGFDVPLTPDQAGLAAIIAGVAAHRSMPVRAVAIAYAAALQESDLANLSYGDRDSVGVFQQRPSQGWGTRRELLDPVFASARFFQALSAVPGYQNLLIYQAAQAVQHSADGAAYRQYSDQGATMADGFAGERPHDVWCWYGTGISGPHRLTAAVRELVKVFGRLRIGRARHPMLQVRVPNRPVGWAVAVWLVTHAKTFGIETVSYQGYQWNSAHGIDGWTKSRPGRGSPQPSSSRAGTQNPGSPGSSPSAPVTDLPGHRSSDPRARGDAHHAPASQAVTFG